MDDYIEHLIEDFREAAKKVPHPSEFWDKADTENEAELEDLSYVNQYLYGTPEKLSSIFGIESILLPPRERLSNEQAALLYREMEELWNAYNFYPDFPETLPEPIRYVFLRDYWDTKHTRMDFGQVHIEFCEYEPDLCPFPTQYCNCKEYRDEEELPGFKEDDSEPPF